MEMCEMELMDVSTEDLLDSICGDMNNDLDSDVGIADGIKTHVKGDTMAIKGRTDLIEGVTMFDCGNGMYFGTVACLTEEVVDAWLARNKDNRKPSKAKITEYRDAKLHGKWKMNGDTIQFSDKGVGISLQHRLLAWKEAYAINPKIKVPVSVSYGTKMSDKSTTDCGYSQTLVHLFQRSKKANAQILGGAVRLFWLRDENMKVSGGKALREDVAKSILKKHPGLEDSCEYVNELNKEQDGGLAPVLQLTYAAALHYLCLTVEQEEVTQEKVQEFFTQIASGEGGKTAAGVKFRNKIIKDNSGTSKVDRDGKIGLFILAFQAHVSGATLGSRWGLKEGEFPRLGGLDEAVQVEDDVEGSDILPEELEEIKAESTPTKRRKRRKATTEAVEGSDILPNEAPEKGSEVMVKITGGQPWKGVVKLVKKDGSCKVQVSGSTDADDIFTVEPKYLTLV